MLAITTFKQFLNDLRRQKLRSALTMFGIFWGSCSIVLLFAFGTGIQEQQLKSQKGMGDNIAIFWPGITSKDFKGLPKGRPVRPDEEDISLIKQTARTVGRISPEYRRWNVFAQYGEQSSVRNVIGVWPEFGEMRNLIPREGSRFLNDNDQSGRKRVVFIGNILADEMFVKEDPIGKELLLNGTPFTVIGVMKEKVQNSSYGGRDSRIAYIPASTFMSMYGTRRVNNFVLQADPQYTMRQCRTEVCEILGARYRFDPTDREALPVWDTTRGFEFLKNFFLAFKWFLVGIGVCTLITGGIGVTNIMNVVLEERTKEIGIKMALGARKSYVMTQFVVETLLITCIGGLLGFGFAALVVSLVPMLPLEDFIGTPRVDILSGIFVTVLLGIVGFFAGIFPARRAANLEPVRALKLF